METDLIDDPLNSSINDQSTPITLDKIKSTMKEMGIFNEKDESLSKKEKQELNGLFDTIGFVMTSRNRQPSRVQNLFATLQTVQSIVSEQLQDGRISLGLASKFHWDKSRSYKPIADNVIGHG